MSRQPSATTNFGRRFWVLAALSLGPAVATSFARFAYALILPAMRAELDLSYSQAGSLNTSNALGYLVGALLCTHYVSRLGNRRLFSFGLVVTVLALLGAGLAETFIGQMALRGVAGISSAMVYISGAVLVSNLYPDRPEVSKTAIAIYFGGAAWAFPGCSRRSVTLRGAARGLQSGAFRGPSRSPASGHPAELRNRRRAPRPSLGR
jgi:predicted MFS family arabinose efflux permease